jgi:hypothetical protein
MGASAERKRWGEVVAVLACVVFSLALNRRFRKYLLAPPTLSSEESRAQSQFVFKFRAICIGVFVLAGFIAFVLHNSDVTLLRGQ